MYNYNELNAVELSPTKKDYYQIWNELIEVAGKLSERWDPSATNESDPGVVLLKVLTAIADKLNYNIDANTLEAFMPTAAQESSMRKLCEMLGYEMRYYQSATTSVRITYKGKEFPENGNINIAKYSNIKDTDSTVNYITLKSISLASETRQGVVDCLEGELVQVQTDFGSTVTLLHLDDNFRFYLPERQIASNGIFINNVGSSEVWEATTNLNAHTLQSKVYKFGYDSSFGLPYIQFPEDIGNLIGTGLEIRFVRTRGVDGNVSAGSLQTMESPSSWKNDTSGGEWLDLENYTITNLTAARNGKNPETIDEAYWNYQKTIGTFDTLVTCRDYMNKIYQMTNSDTDTTALVSNIIVSDIRDDINRAYTINSIDSDGLDSKRKTKYNLDPNRKITHFDLLLYPFQAVYGRNTEDEFNSSFKYTTSPLDTIKERLESQKTIAHNLKSPDSGDIACIKVYAQLSARLATTSKISILEATEVEHAAHTALYKNFNLRNLNFGEELPYDSILKVLTMADPRIKNVTLDDPKMTVVVCTVDGTEYPIISDHIFDTEDQAKKACAFYKQLVLDNVLAGKIPLFQYDSTFDHNLTDKPYPEGKYPGENATIKFPTFLSTGDEIDRIYLDKNGKLKQEPKQENSSSSFGKIKKISSEVKIDATTINPNGASLTLGDNEIIQFRAPNFKATATYPAFVNYFVHLDPESNGNSNALRASSSAVPATMYTLREFFNGRKDDTSNNTGWTKAKSWEEKVNSLPSSLMKEVFSTGAEIIEGSAAETEANQNYNQAKEKYKAVFTKSDKYYLFEPSSGQLIPPNTTFYALVVDSHNYMEFLAWLCGGTTPKIIYRADPSDAGGPEKLEGSNLISGLYYKKISTLSRSPGYLKENGGGQYAELTSWTFTGNMFDTLYVPRLWSKDTTEHLKSGLGKDEVANRLIANTEYSLGAKDYILISYSTSEGREDGTTVVKNIELGTGTIIKANFELEDSKAKSATTRYSKLNGYGPWKNHSVAEVPGMYACAADEQIEVLEPITVTLDSSDAHLYWEINPQNQKVIVLNNVEHEQFPFDATGAYTLQDGEYLFFTDANMESAAYYGAGTEIKIDPDNVTEVVRSKDAGKISAEALSEAGAIKAIPWVKINLTGCPITISEYRLINLAKGDTLTNISFGDDNKQIGKEFKKIKAASYILNGQEDTLPTIAVADMGWEVRSILNINMGPNTPQVLTTHKSGQNSIIARDLICITYEYKTEEDKTEEKDFVLTPLDDAENNTIPMTIYSDAPLVSIAGNLSFNQNTLSPLLTVPKAFKICESDKSSTFSLAFDVDGLAQINPEDTSSKIFNILIPDDKSYGLLPIYYSPASCGFASIRLSEGSAGIFNHGTTHDWWTGTEVSGNELAGIVSFSGQGLRAGLNMVVIKNSCNLRIGLTEPTDTSTIIKVGKLKIIPKEKMLNSKLAFENYSTGDSGLDTTLYFRYYDTDGKIDTTYVKETSVLDKTGVLVEQGVLDYIRDLDPSFEFFYTAEPSVTGGLDLNELDPTDTMAQPKAWFDKQNLANKFVVSALDSKYLQKYVSVSKYSKIF